VFFTCKASLSTQLCQKPAWDRTERKHLQNHTQHFSRNALLRVSKWADKMWTLPANRGMSFGTSSVIEGKNNSCTNVQWWEIFMVRCCWWEERLAIASLLCWILWKKTSGRFVQSQIAQTYLKYLTILLAKHFWKILATPVHFKLLAQIDVQICQNNHYNYWSMYQGDDKDIWTQPQIAVL